MTDLQLPALYLGHGAPPLLDDPLWMAQLAGWAQALPRPKAVLIVSAHWQTAPMAIGATTTGVTTTLGRGGSDFSGAIVGDEALLWNKFFFSPDDRLVAVKVSQGGDGLCEGELNLFSANGKEVWIIKPELYADKHLGGDGEKALGAGDDAHQIVA